MIWRALGGKLWAQGRLCFQLVTRRQLAAATKGAEPCSWPAKSHHWGQRGLSASAVTSRVSALECL